MINENLLQFDEKIVYKLRELYSSYNYNSYRMSKFEEYDLYAKNKQFLLSDNVITFTDTNGKLLALKPDVTLSIIKNSKDLPSEIQKVFYNENVYRVSKGTSSFQEKMQVGLECFGNVDKSCVCEVICLAAKSLQRVADKCVLELSNLSIIEKAVDALNLPSDSISNLYKAIGEKNIHDIELICSESNADVKLVSDLVNLISIKGDIFEVISKLNSSEFDDFKSVLEDVSKSDVANLIKVDFSVVDDTNYYNGIVFKGFIDGIPNATLSGGQYDKLMQKMQRKSKAIGFAVYLDELERVCDEQKEDNMLNVALPKGRLGEKIYKMFAKAGFECPSILEPNRKLIFENEEKGVRYFWVKPSDVAIYVERGAADIGVAGKDILLEYNPDIYEMLDLDTGKCKMAVAAPKTFVDDHSRTLRVATKFSNIARSYYQSKGRDIDIIHLNGSIEIAPILGLSDVIVDIVETGATLRENDLEVFEDIVPISARLISNKTSYKFKSSKIDEVVSGMVKLLEEKND